MYIYVWKLPPGNLNLGSCLPHLISTNTCRVTITPRVCGGFLSSLYEVNYSWLPYHLLLHYKGFFFSRLLGALWHCCLNNSFQCLNNNKTSGKYFYNTQTRISTTLKTKQQYLNTATKRALFNKNSGWENVR